MKSILIIALALIATITASAQTPAAKETGKATISVDADISAPAMVTVPAAKQSAADDATAVGTGNVSPNFAGTNDLNLLLLRQGIKKA